MIGRARFTNIRDIIHAAATPRALILRADVIVALDECNRRERSFGVTSSESVITDPEVLTHLENLRMTPSEDLNDVIMRVIRQGGGVRQCRKNNLPFTSRTSSVMITTFRRTVQGWRN